MRSSEPAVRGVLAAGAAVALTGCILDRGPLLPSTIDGRVGSGECADVTVAVSPPQQFICADARDVTISWSAPAREVILEGGRRASGLVQTDVWTQPDDITSAPIPAVEGCTVERRASDQCAFPRYPATGSETIRPGEDTLLRYFVLRRMGRNIPNRCFFDHPIKVTPVGRNRTPLHVEEFRWVCDAAAPTGRYETRTWDPAEFAVERVVNGYVANASSVPVTIGLRRRDRTTGLDEFRTAENVPPGAETLEFGGPSEGLWTVTTDLSRFGPTRCPDPPPGATAPPPPPPGSRVPPTLRLEFGFTCVGG